VAETVREIGITPWSAQGTAERQAWVADLADDGLFGPKGTAAFAAARTGAPKPTVSSPTSSSPRTALENCT